jgi:hypothetical protein
MLAIHLCKGCEQLSVCGKSFVLSMAGENGRRMNTESECCQEQVQEGVGMTKVRVAGVLISLDRFCAGPKQSLENS